MLNNLLLGAAIGLAGGMALAAIFLWIFARRIENQGRRLGRREGALRGLRCGFHFGYWSPDAASLQKTPQERERELAEQLEAIESASLEELETSLKMGLKGAVYRGLNA